MQQNLKQFVMSDFDSLLAQAIQLPLNERLQLIDSLWASVPEESQVAISKEWLAEIQRRSDEFDSGEVKTIPWETVRDEALQRTIPPKQP